MTKRERKEGTEGKDRRGLTRRDRDEAGGREDEGNKANSAQRK